MDPRELKARQEEKERRKALINRAFDRAVDQQLAKHRQQQQHVVTDVIPEDNELHRQVLDRERERKQEQKGKIQSEELQTLMASGLSGSVAALMAQQEKSQDGTMHADNDDRNRKKNDKKRKRRSRPHESSRSRSSSSSNIDSSDESNDTPKQKKQKYKRKSKKRSSRDENTDDDSSNDERDKKRRKKDKKKKRRH